MANSKSSYELADVVHKFGKQLIQQKNLSPQHIKVLHNIVQCRTASMGGHEEVCDNCGEIRYSYNSCGDRHCPKCQNTKQAIWVEELMQATLQVKHYHIIFTVPHCLNKICLWDNKSYYKILFSAVRRTLHSFGYTHFGAEMGAVAVLHTWGQNLTLHPHIHCIVPAAGYSLKGEWKNIGKYENYLYPIHQLSSSFKGKFLSSLKLALNKSGMLNAFDNNIQQAYNKNWVVHSEASFANVEHVIKYLGQYTHRVAITNQRILNITDTHVTFIAKDYRDKAQKKPVTLEGVEFLKRFCLHILPKGFVRIRRFGIYNSTTKRNLKLQFKPEQKPDIEQLIKPKGKESSMERIKRLTGFDIGLCPSCKKGRLRVIYRMPRIRAPPAYLPKILLSKLK